MESYEGTRIFIVSGIPVNWSMNWHIGGTFLTLYGMNLMIYSVPIIFVFRYSVFVKYFFTKYIYFKNIF